MRGIVSGISKSSDYTIFFDWFYPDYFITIANVLSVVQSNNEVAY